LQQIDGIVLPGGESTAIGLIGTSTTCQTTGQTMWKCLQDFCQSKPAWGTCAGMILLADKCVGASAVIENGQSLIGGVDITVCRNYFGSQISSFELPTPAPPGFDQDQAFPGVFIRAPAILSAGPGVSVLAKVTATPCRQAAEVLKELERKIAAGENVIQLGVNGSSNDDDRGTNESNNPCASPESVIVLPGASQTDAREVICVVRRDNLLCTAFHPELTDDNRWHEYFVRMVQESMS
jgi:5'-phosphate synthase pdxT subunit